MKSTMFLSICKNRFDCVEGDFLLENKYFAGMSNRNRVKLSDVEKTKDVLFRL